MLISLQETLYHRQDMTEILLKVALNTLKIKIKNKRRKKNETNFLF
jgi:hypothetical protein